MTRTARKELVRQRRNVNWWNRRVAPVVRRLEGEVKWIGVRDQLQLCSPSIDPSGPLNLSDLMDELYKLNRFKIKAGTDDRIEFLVSVKNAPMVKRILKNYRNA